ncbi:hypothetical protein DMH02_005605 [Streptomyces sp. WAC 00631]|uniref:hypothetical protein n=1 Tax=Streptomyces sp. WAC 00631 TaxID=2203201 RepID=UPI000F77A2EB|nr:hypothetical protein [Streptomyces sp. WAC 00631]MCC5032728.1 hypothetical protein [Streptomyces sp. WAC 00631]
MDNHFAQEFSGPPRPDQEAGLLAELGRAKVPAADQQKVLHTLRKDPYGAAVAELIGRGHLRELDKYGKILDMCKQGASRRNPDNSMVPAAYMALSHATELQNHGLTRLGFELDTDAFDLDVYTRNPDGTVGYGYQLKDVNTIKGIKNAAKKAADQLKGGDTSHRVAILDVHQPMSALTPKAFADAEYAARRSESTFLLRFEDGAITIPPNGSIFP